LVSIGVSLILAILVLVAGFLFGALIVTVCLPPEGSCVSDWRTWWVSWGTWGFAAVIAALVLVAGIRRELIPLFSAGSRHLWTFRSPFVLALLALGIWFAGSFIIALTGGIGDP
jgi:hypothetical protein